MDRANPIQSRVPTGISIRHGPMEEMDIDEPVTEKSKANGANTGKRKSRQSMTNRKSYKEASSEADGDGKPLVSLIWLQPQKILAIDLSQE